MKRMRRIFGEDGRTVIVAMDHGMGMEVNPALDHTEEILKAIIAGGADALLLSYGIAVKYMDILQDVGVIVRCDRGYSALTSKGGTGCPNLLFSVEDALRIGADAVACNGFPGVPEEQACMKNVSELVRQGNAWGVPVMAEMLPGGFANSAPTFEETRLAVRTGCEYGASIIKTKFVGNDEEFRQIVEASYQPVVILGGAATKELPGLFSCIEKAIKLGASGVAIGRNVWNHPDPEAVTRALVKLVHQGASASDIHL